MECVLCIFLSSYLLSLITLADSHHLPESGRVTFAPRKSSFIVKPKPVNGHFPLFDGLNKEVPSIEAAGRCMHDRAPERSECSADQERLNRESKGSHQRYRSRPSANRRRLWR